MFRYIKILIIVFLCTFFLFSYGQKKKRDIKKSHLSETVHKRKKGGIKYGIASFYAKKFNGKKTANGETYLNDKFTAACNLFPLNTWIKVTDLKNDRSVIVRINDRLHAKNKRVVDLSEIAAKKLGFVSSGLAKVKVEVLNNYHKADG